MVVAVAGGEGAESPGWSPAGLLHPNRLELSLQGGVLFDEPAVPSVVVAPMS